MDGKTIIVTIGFILLLSVPGIVLGLDIKFSHGSIAYLPFMIIFIGGACMIPMFRYKKPNDEVVN